MSARDDHPVSPEEWLSAEFDDEAVQPADIPPDRRDQLLKEWQRLRQLLHESKIAVEADHPVDLVSAVRKERERQPVTAASRIRSVRQGAGRVFGPAVRLLVTAAVVLLAILPFIRSMQDGGDRGDSISRVLPSILPTAGAEDWNVVVVNIGSDGSLEDSVDRLLGAAQQHGADVMSWHPTADDGAEYSAGLLLTAGTDPGLISDSVPAEQIEWNPVRIDGRSPEEIKRLFLESLKVPSQSERVFGAIYIVDEKTLEVTARPTDDRSPVISVADDDSAVSGGAADRLLPGPAQPGMSAEPSVPQSDSAGHPLIVIFRRAGTDRSRPDSVDRSSQARPADDAAEPGDQGCLDALPHPRPAAC